MSAFSKYAAASEHNTAVQRRETVATLIEWAIVVPVPGDMLATLSRAPITQRTRRRRLAFVCASREANQ